MALILGFLGREQRRGNGAWAVGRRWNDPQIRDLRLARAHLDAQAQRLLQLTDAQVDAWRVR
jgi:hypothetical protein